MMIFTALRVASAVTALSSLGFASVAYSGAAMPVQQMSPCTCWAASAAMMLSARDGIPYTELSAAQAAGADFVTRVQAVVPGENCEYQGLPGDDVNRFAGALGLTVNPPNNPTLAQWQTMLTKGPVWAGIVLKEGAASWFGHIIVVTSISTLGAPNPDVTFIDPKDGTFHTVKFDVLKTAIENVPEQWAPTMKLPTQFLYWK
ncbi:hypothetical protein H8F23_23425 [Pseudomonas sp. P155]|uniref:Peptidase C39-like domain-containing protein n=1 Tax=Pseudomonas neuropathica TaxID=2730425 RepID=A0ABS0BP37_9PSED|nr:papain-like cysteine protease family protein [Pseudomonas neuropathica]MBF6036210.1 hypothetical protein [Pseudomonas neuropathica]